MGEFYKKKKLPPAIERELKRTLERPSWESMNEGVHERVSFDDTIWGFNLAGGAYYNTPLRVTMVKDGSRAERAGIKVGDIVTSINDVDTSTLTVQEAHDIVLESGLEIKLAVEAPDVEETTHYIYQDEFEEEEWQTKEKYNEKKIEEKKEFKGAKVNKAWSILWPCNKKRDVIYRESNCFMVSSRYEATHPERLLVLKGVENSATVA